MARRILLHMCCAPCSIVPLNFFSEHGFKPVGLFYNPNIHPYKEFLKRKKEITNISKKYNIDIIVESKWDFLEWIKYQNNIYDKPYRCKKCILQRLKFLILRAKELNINCVSTSLLYSIYQPHHLIKSLLTYLCKENNLEFIYHDFRNNWKHGQELAFKWNIYRQSYCGCLFSEEERYLK